jgi:hypothetical protein
MQISLVPHSNIFAGAGDGMQPAGNATTELDARRANKGSNVKAKCIVILFRC